MHFSCFTKQTVHQEHGQSDIMRIMKLLSTVPVKVLAVPMQLMPNQWQARAWLSGAVIHIATHTSHDDFSGRVVHVFVYSRMLIIYRYDKLMN